MSDIQFDSIASAHLNGVSSIPFCPHCAGADLKVFTEISKIRLSRELSCQESSVARVRLGDSSLNILRLRPSS